MKRNLPILYQKEITQLSTAAICRQLEWWCTGGGLAMTLKLPPVAKVHLSFTFLGASPNGTYARDWNSHPGAKTIRPRLHQCQTSI